MDKSQLLFKMFSKLGDEEVINDEQCADAEKLVCYMYGQKKLSSVAEARLEMFLKKYKPKIGKNHISCAKKMDGSSLPQCSPVILQKLRRTNYVCIVNVVDQGIITEISVLDFYYQ